jgi:hypothetical protein
MAVPAWRDSKRRYSIGLSGYQEIRSESTRTEMGIPGIRISGKLKKEKLLSLIP